MRDLVRHGGLLAAPTLVHRTRLAKRTVQLALDDLEEIGIVDSSGNARTRLYRFDPRHPLAASIAALFEAERARFDEIISAIRETADREGVLAVWLYGSVARGEDHAKSDVDIALFCERASLVKSEDGVRSKLMTVGDKLFFKASVIAIDADDILRLEKTNDPWWRGVRADAWSLKGESPEFVAERISREAERGSAA